MCVRCDAGKHPDISFSGLALDTAITDTKYGTAASILLADMRLWQGLALQTMKGKSLSIQSRLYTATVLSSLQVADTAQRDVAVPIVQLQ